VTTGEPRASSSDGEEAETPSSGYSHAETFPVIAQLITSTNEKSKQWAKRFEVSTLMVSDPGIAQLVKRTSERQRRDSIITAGNMFDFWSKEMTQRTNPYLAKFSRHRIDDEAAYWDNSLGAVPGIEQSSVTESVEEIRSFVAESFLQAFLEKNWTLTSLGKTHDIFEIDGVQVGAQFQTETGPLDLLAESKDKKELLVIELKKGRAYDKVLGQLQRYMGYVADKVAEPGQIVRGLIIALEDDRGLQYALKVAPNVSFMRYSIDFKLLP